MIRPYQKAANDKNIKMMYDAMIEACNTQRNFIDKRIPCPIVMNMRAQYAKNIKAIIEAKYALARALAKPVSPPYSDDMSNSTKFIIDRILRGGFKIKLANEHSEVKSGDQRLGTWLCITELTDVSIPLTITMTRRRTSPVTIYNHSDRKGFSSFELSTSIPGLFTEKEVRIIDINYYDDIRALGKRIQEAATRATEEAVVAGAIKEVTRLYKEAGLDIQN